MAGCPRCHQENVSGAKFCAHCGAMLDAHGEHAKDPWIGRVLQGRYRVVSVLGEGGMGKVFLAEQKMGNATRKVAIKTLHADLRSDPQLIARFHRESETVIQLTHPNTIQFYDFGELEDGTLLIVMEYIQGQSLADHLERGPMPLVRVHHVLAQVCGSLQEAHALGVVHRDLKPENILLTVRGGHQDFVKVLDFGIARRSEGGSKESVKLTQKGMVLGTPPYMSPEQFSGKTLDARSDVYSLGAVTYEMLVGDLPFEAQTSWEWATKHLTARPKPIEAFDVGKTIPEAQRTAVMKALEKDPRKRYGSVAEFFDAFQVGFTPTDNRSTATPWAYARGSNPGSNPGVVSKQGPGQVEPGVGGISSGSYPQSDHAGVRQRHGQSSAVQSSAVRAAASVPGTEELVMSNIRGGSRRTLTFALLAFAGLLVFGGGAFAVWSLTDTPSNAETEDLAGAPEVGDGVGEEGIRGMEGADVVSAGNESAIGSAQAAHPSPVGEKSSKSPSFDEIAASDEGATSEQSKSAARPKSRATRGSAKKTPSKPTKRDASKKTEVGLSDKPASPPPEKQENPPAPPVSAVAGNAVQEGKRALESGDIRQAVAALSVAKSKLGARHPQVRALARMVTRKGANKVGILLQQGNCDGAQDLYRSLKAVGAGRAARSNFADWCPAP